MPVEYMRNMTEQALSEDDFRGLARLISHAHSPPLKPAPALKYDLRSCPNPPKQIRDTYTGVDKRLREHILAHEAFTAALLRRAEAEITQQMDAIKAQWLLAQTQVVKPGTTAALAPDEQTTKSLLVKVQGQGEDDNGNDDQEEDEEDDKEDDDDDGFDDDSEVDNTHNLPNLTIRAFCARGHHGSVAFVEELARKPWPRGWEIQVLHRNLHGDAAAGAKSKRERQREWRGRGLRFAADQQQQSTPRQRRCTRLLLGTAFGPGPEIAYMLAESIHAPVTHPQSHLPY
jgi:hypothetical protein